MSGSEKQLSEAEKEIKRLILDNTFVGRVASFTRDYPNGEPAVAGAMTAAHAIAKLFEDQEAEHHTWMLEAHLKRGELEAELADAKITIGALEATIETREEMEEELRARVEWMAKHIETALRHLGENNPETVNWLRVAVNELNEALSAGEFGVEGGAK